MTARIGTAPVSFGIFATARGEAALTPPQLLETMAQAGYGGSELGPPGFFGTPDQAAAAFRDAGLAMLAAYMPLHLALGDDVWRRDLDGMRRSLEELQAGGNPHAVAVLADEGDAGLIARPYRAPGERGLSPAQWERAAERVAAARDEALTYGVAVSFHPHYGTYVEQPAEIETLLRLADIDLCYDMGHVQLGGAEPVDFARRHADRIAYVHVKDLHEAVRDAARDRRDTDFEAWWEGLCCPLGEGDVDVAGVVGALTAAGYDGWWTIEQDRGPVSRETWRDAAAQQAANRAWLAARL
jgi:inosose dehydratase